MLSDTKRFKKTKVVQKDNWYTDNDKLNAVKLYLLTGNKAATAASLGIHINTFYNWCNSEWFKDLTREIQAQNNIELTTKLRGIAEKALEATADRIAHGDWVLNQKTGEMIRKPIVVRDAHRIASDFISKANDQEDRLQRETGEHATQGKLEQLAEAFAKFASKTTKIEVIDVVSKEINDAVHDKRGVQETDSSGTTGISQGKEQTVLFEKSGETVSP